MKVVLTAFDGLLRSEVKELPEHLDDIIHYPLRQLKCRHVFGSPEEQANLELIDLRATFRRSGTGFIAKDRSPVREYELVNVSPQHWDDS